MPGTKLAVTGDVSVLFGCPPEIIKVLMNSTLPFPDAIILPDKFEVNGVLQNCTEFPLYYFLFSLGHFFKGKKLIIGGEKNEVENNLKLLNLTLLGPSQADYDSLPPSPWFKNLYAQSRYLSLKHPVKKKKHATVQSTDNNEVSIQEMIEKVIFEDGILRIGNILVTHTGLNTYSIDDVLIDCNFSDEQVPPYVLNEGYVPNLPMGFGIDVLGGGSGFTKTKPCSCILLNHNSDYMLLDCLPFIDAQLKARGLCLEQVSSVFVSHIHDDHCNLFPFVLSGLKIDLLTTQEIYWMVIHKLAFMTGRAPSEFKEYFNFIEVKPYENTAYFGIDILPHYSVHSIPTIGAVFSNRHSGRTYSIGFSGDNKGLVEIQKMTSEGIVPQIQSSYLFDFYKKRFDLLVADGGSGLLHGEPRDAINSESRRIVFLHLENLDPEFGASFAIARSGKRFSILGGNSEMHSIFMSRLLERCYPGIHDKWINVLLNDMTVRYYNSEDIIIRQGEKKDDVISVVLSGRCAVLWHDGKKLSKIAEKQVGDFLGELAIIKGDSSRTASIIAETPVIICELNDDVYLNFLKAENRLSDFSDHLWERFTLERVYPFSKFCDPVKDTICRMGNVLLVKPGDVVLMNAENYYFLLKGQMKVQNQNTEHPADEGCVYCAGNAKSEQMSKFKAVGECALFVISKEKMHDLCKIIPRLNYHMKGNTINK